MDISENQKMISKQQISRQFDRELNAINQKVVLMSKTASLQTFEACEALLRLDTDKATEVCNKEVTMNQLERDLDRKCIQLIARHQPTAGDLRNLVSIMKIITELERIGDEAERIALMAIEISNDPENNMPFSDIVPNIQLLTRKVIKNLSAALQAAESSDTSITDDIIAQDESIDHEYKKLIQVLLDLLGESPKYRQPILSLIWCARSLERIGDHIKNICEHLIYRVDGMDVRHLPHESNTS